MCCGNIEQFYSRTQSLPKKSKVTAKILVIRFAGGVRAHGQQIVF